MSALKPCPFCGDESAIVIAEDRVWIECADCPNKAEVGPFNTVDDATAAWNTRTPTDQLSTLMGEVRGAIQSLIDDCEADYPPSHGALKYGLKDILAKLGSGS